ncbi:MAG: hypothetical protein GY696_08515, partial [Gammaproteobacteria bacterium]|nr:hypothetical protein [Gammaproteobacteria bacterium]
GASGCHWEPPEAAGEEERRSHLAFGTSGGDVRAGNGLDICWTAQKEQEEEK